MPKVVGVRFSRGSKIYDFDAGLFVLKPGDFVIVDTEAGLALGEITRGPRALPEPPEGSEAPPLKQVFRLATPEDLEQQTQNTVLEKEAYRYCQERVAARKLDMNLVKVECLFDRTKMIFFFTAEGRLDFRELVRDMVGRLRTRVEMRQIGVRHEAKLLGGLGSCGREICCATFLKDFEPVSVKMAKEQNLSLNPTKISGLCGRLMCCLTYEFETYKALKKDLPKLGKRLNLADGREAKVIRQNVLEKRVTLYIPGEGELAVGPEELDTLLNRPPEQAPAPANNDNRANKAKPAAPGPANQDQPNAPESEATDGKPASSRRRRPRRRGKKGPKTT
ncbi:MAG: stage 0 sporulation family protein [Desulfarculus sp.]|nr:stage 0 sporulation family protein [Pseudomonadota bacterium]MBV1714987.1 stage 0 sporulation family protein [Desulfarculus sp.]MBU4573911.1 stage 0 sporulation family protein [Pseudomonadota bacterium]MBU4598960.1 stage 0 sporulation family protein [Pseudomonadota bacterium]MBV1737487.1 stage 0 sporulation family protein [Desulfarculus sp.]